MMAIMLYRFFKAERNIYNYNVVMFIREKIKTIILIDCASVVLAT